MKAFKSLRSIFGYTSMLQTQRNLFILSGSKHGRIGTRRENLPYCLPISTLPSSRFYCSQASSVSIIELEEHKTIKTAFASLKNPGTLDTLAGSVLDNNIQVPSVSLQNNLVVYRSPGTLRGVVRTELSKNLPKEITTGKFTPWEDEIIDHNWEKLLAISGISSCPQLCF